LASAYRDGRIVQRRLQAAKRVAERSSGLSTTASLTWTKPSQRISPAMIGFAVATDTGLLEEVLELASRTPCEPETRARVVCAMLAVVERQGSTADVKERVRKLVASESAVGDRFATKVLGQETAACELRFQVRVRRPTTS